MGCAAWAFGCLWKLFITSNRRLFGPPDTDIPAGRRVCHSTFPSASSLTFFPHLGKIGFKSLLAPSRRPREGGNFALFWKSPHTVDLCNPKLQRAQRSFLCKKNSYKAKLIPCTSSKQNVIGMKCWSSELLDSRRWTTLKVQCKLANRWAQRKSCLLFALLAYRT